jgi:hypothetical protein
MMDARLKHTFDHDYEMWHAYDYAACLRAGGRDIYRPATWEARGGVNDSGYIWVDDSRWSVETPEGPHSILAIMTWRQWYLRGPVDLRGATMSVHLRGDELDLRGGRCLFWILSRKLSTRWHLSSAPLRVENGQWMKSTIPLAPSDELWHRSWTVPGNAPAGVTDVLAAVDSFGFSFVGFDDIVTGRFAIDEFELRPRQ